MYDVRVVYQDYQKYDVEIDDDNVDRLMEAISKGTTYFDKTKAVGFFVPALNIRCVYLQKQNKESQECQKSPLLEAESASQV
jgi:hypothetical protein